MIVCTVMIHSERSTEAECSGMALQQYFSSDAQEYGPFLPKLHRKCADRRPDDGGSNGDGGACMEISKEDQLCVTPNSLGACYDCFLSLDVLSLGRPATLLLSLGVIVR